MGVVDERRSMRATPAGLDERDLFDALRRGWGIEVADAAYVPVGGGDYHWRVTDRAGARRWVTVGDLDNKEFLGRTRSVVVGNLRRALDTAYALREAGLEFVVAPMRTGDGHGLRRVGGRHVVAVFPFLDLPAGTFGEARSVAERAAVVDALARLHRADSGTARVARPEVPYRAELEAALRAPDRPWWGGPHAEPARCHLADHAAEVRRLLDRFDRLVERVRASGAEAVVTHGEPHPGNVMLRDGRVLLIDWDTLALALPERDLWMLDGADERARYAAASGRPVDEAAMRLYRLRWHLDDIAYAVHRLRSAGGGDPDTARTWNWFVGAFESDGPSPYGRP
jgi:spectinomycin phosphotransferase